MPSRASCGNGRWLKMLTRGDAGRRWDEGNRFNRRTGSVRWGRLMGTWPRRWKSANLDKMIALPRGPKGPFEAPAGVLLLQALTHSQHHRGQNASRMRQLGATPPMTDFVIWYALGGPRPALSPTHARFDTHNSVTAAPNCVRLMAGGGFRR